MPTYKIGGIGFGTIRDKDTSDVLNKAKNGDIYKLNRKTSEIAGVVVDVNMVVQGKGPNETFLTIPENKAGFILSGSGILRLQDLTIRVSQYANGIRSLEDATGKLILENVRVIHNEKTPIEAKYPLITLDGKEQGIHRYSDVSGVFVNSRIEMISADLTSIRIDESEIGLGYPNMFSKISSITTDISNSNLENIRIHHMGNKPAALNEVSTSMGNIRLSGNIKIDGFTIDIVEPLQKQGLKKFTEQVEKITSNPVLDLPNRWFTLVLDKYNSLPANVNLTNFGLTEETMEFFDLDNPFVPTFGPGGEYDFSLGWFALMGDLVQLQINDSYVPNSPTGRFISKSTITLKDTTDEEYTSYPTGEEPIINLINSSTLMPIKGQNAGTEISKEEAVKALDQLDALTGLGNVKKTIHQIVATATMNEERKRAGVKSASGLSLHTVFAGEAGTGKTTVARIYARALFEQGVTRTPNFTEATRKDLVAGHVGQTAEKTHKIIEQALGGVLFIDEAYSLASTGGNDFADEAVAQLIADMENHRDDLVVILAGYTDEMKDFIMNGNPGLQSRFTNWVEFEDYSEHELKLILHMQLTNQSLRSDDAAFEYATERMIDIFTKMHNEDPSSTGNARFVRNFVQAVVMAMNSRLMSVKDRGSMTARELSTYTISDIDTAYESLELRFKQMKM